VRDCTFGVVWYDILDEALFIEVNVGVACH
jgi:hypothetical protein